jgi:hypothetical protein
VEVLADMTISPNGAGPIFRSFSSFTVSGNDVAIVGYRTPEYNHPFVYSYRGGILRGEISGETIGPGGANPIVNAVRP